MLTVCLQVNGFADIGNGVGGNADVSQGCVGTGVIGDLLDEIESGESIRCERALVLVVDCSEECLSHGVRSHVFDAQFLPDVRENSPVGLDGQTSISLTRGKERCVRLAVGNGNGENVFPKITCEIVGQGDLLNLPGLLFPDGEGRDDG